MRVAVAHMGRVKPFVTGRDFAQRNKVFGGRETAREVLQP